MMEERIISSVSIRSEDNDRKRLCDLGVDSNGHLYIIDVEQDRKNGKKKYVACIDSYFGELKKLMKEKQLAM